MTRPRLDYQTYRDRVQAHDLDRSRRGRDYCTETAEQMNARLLELDRRNKAYQACLRRLVPPDGLWIGG